MRKLHNILPMAGRGSRFAEAGYTTPKPLIPVDGQPMLKKALSSLEGIDAEQRYKVILRKEYDRKYDLGARIEVELPGAINSNNRRTYWRTSRCVPCSPLIEDYEG